jgi:hypothetical protein
MVEHAMSDKAERVAKSRHAAECLWRDLPLKEDGTFRSTTSSLDTIEKHMVAFLEGHRPDPDVSEAEKALCMDILGERGRSVDEVNRLVTLLIAYREGLKAQAASDVTARPDPCDKGTPILTSLSQWMTQYGQLMEIARCNGWVVPDVSALREGIYILQHEATIASSGGSEETYIGYRNALVDVLALLHSEPKLGGTV